mmetsp:Transcript_108717/g.318064  ORF Transcript_108717/g.318064 Transcript_108717/m.318064 type:complete len:274 (+) Transcript_108717:200-1021(+)
MEAVDLLLPSIAAQVGAQQVPFFLGLQTAAHCQHGQVHERLPRRRVFEVHEQSSAAVFQQDKIVGEQVKMTKPQRGGLREARLGRGLQPRDELPDPLQHGEPGVLLLLGVRQPLGQVRPAPADVPLDLVEHPGQLRRNLDGVEPLDHVRDGPKQGTVLAFGSCTVDVGLRQGAAVDEVDHQRIGQLGVLDLRAHAHSRRGGGRRLLASAGNAEEGQVGPNAHEVAAALGSHDEVLVGPALAEQELLSDVARCLNDDLLAVPALQPPDTLHPAR